jgi:hypothetical protein
LRQTRIEIFVWRARLAYLNSSRIMFAKSIVSIGASC